MYLIQSNYNVLTNCTNWPWPPLPLFVPVLYENFIFISFLFLQIQLVTAGSKYKNVFDAVDFHQWKRLRAIGSPSFSARRMKEVRYLLWQWDLIRNHRFLKMKVNANTVRASIYSSTRPWRLYKRFPTWFNDSHHGLSPFIRGSHPSFTNDLHL